MIPAGSHLEVSLITLFWLSAAGVTYSYGLYPILVFALSRCRRPVAPPGLAPEHAPSVSLVIAAHNEEDVIEGRILNALALQYPSGKLRIVVASDGSDDNTNALILKFRDRISPRIFDQRRGKAATLNDCIAPLDSDIIALSDANTLMDPDALTHLTRWFADPSVGAVCGRLCLTDPDTGRNADSLYWKYETFLKACEGRLGGLLGANGAIYAIRRTLFQPLPNGTIVDDFVIPLRARLQTRCRLIYDPLAVAREEAAPSFRSEFGRRTRIGVGGWQALSMLWPLLHPRHGAVSFTFLSHKVMRWACPFLMLGALASSCLLAAMPFFATALAAQTGFYTLCAAVALIPGKRTWSRPSRLCCMFGTMNLALLVGFIRWLRGDHTGSWRRTARTAGG